MESRARVFTDYHTGTQWLVRIIDEGEVYGNGAEWKGPRGVVFYDFDYAFQGDFGPAGQQVSTYYLHTLLEHSSGYGLDLCTYELKWKISWGCFSEIYRFLEDNAVVIA